MCQVQVMFWSHDKNIIEPLSKVNVQLLQPSKNWQHSYRDPIRTALTNYTMKTTVLKRVWNYILSTPLQILYVHAYGCECLQSYATLKPSHLIVSMRIVGIRYLISHHLTSLISVSRINPVWVNPLMLLLSSFFSSRLLYALQVLRL